MQCRMTDARKHTCRPEISLLHAVSCCCNSLFLDSSALIAAVSSKPDWIFLVSCAFRAVRPRILERSSSTCCCASDALCSSSAAHGSGNGQ